MAAASPTQRARAVPFVTLERLVSSLLLFHSHTPTDFDALATGGRGGTTSSGNARGGNGSGTSGTGGTASSGDSGTARGGGVTNTGGSVTNTGGSSTGGRGGTSNTGSATGGYGNYVGFTDVN